MFAIAYRILGSVAEAEDAVEETWLRYESFPTQLTSTKAFLSAVVTRISVDVLRSARARRGDVRRAVVPRATAHRPLRGPRAVGRAGRLGVDGGSVAARAAQPARAGRLRAAGHVRVRLSRDRIGRGQIGGGRAASSRVGARRHMDAGRPRFEADRREREELAARFFDALQDGVIGALRELLAADVQMVGDSGGKAPALARSVIGADNVARVLASIFPVLVRIDAKVEPREVNGQPGAILRDRDGNVVGTLTLDVLDGQIQTIRAVSNPDKLGHVDPVADAWARVEAGSPALGLTLFTQLGMSRRSVSGPASGHPDRVRLSGLLWITVGRTVPLLGR